MERETNQSFEAIVNHTDVIGAPRGPPDGDGGLHVNRPVGLNEVIELPLVITCPNQQGLASAFIGQ